MAPADFKYPTASPSLSALIAALGIDPTHFENGFNEQLSFTVNGTPRSGYV